MGERTQTPDEILEEQSVVLTVVGEKLAKPWLLSEANLDEIIDVITNARAHIMMCQFLRTTGQGWVKV